MEFAKLLGVGAKCNSLGAGYRSAPPITQLHVPREATLEPQNTTSGLPVLILSGYEIGHSSHPSDRAGMRQLPQ